MATTRKAYVAQVTADIIAAPRPSLAGNGIAPKMLSVIANRPDILAKLATFIYSTKFAMKGAKGLKKSPLHQIKAYKNFNEFNRTGREDVEDFKSSLPEQDAKDFVENENCIVILALPDNLSNQSIDEAVASGKSVALKFDRAVRSEYKIPGGFYIVIMFGNSIIKPVEEKRAETKANVNARKNERRKPAVIKNELKEKTRLKEEIAENKPVQGTVGRQQMQQPSQRPAQRPMQQPAQRPAQQDLIDDVMSFL